MFDEKVAFFWSLEFSVGPNMKSYIKKDISSKRDNLVKHT